MQVYLAKPRGFCAGVDRAIEIVERALCVYGAPIYVRHEVVHNRYVVEGLKDKGAVFVEDLNDVPENSTVVFSAHGVAKAIRVQAKKRELRVFDATCPLVTKVHNQVTRSAKEEREVLMIGHNGHPEVEGTMGQLDEGIHLIESETDVKNLNVKNPEKLSFVTQTTLSVDDTAGIVGKLRNKFPKIKGPKHDDICYATQNRQDAVKMLAECCDLILVVGSSNSSNSTRLRELAENLGIDAYMLDDPKHINEEWFDGKKAVGVTAGASAPEELLQAILSGLKDIGAIEVEELEGVKEQVIFSLPKELT